MQERIFDFIFDDGYDFTADFTAAEFEHELLNLESYLKAYYLSRPGRKYDDTYLNQRAYFQIAELGRRTLLNCLCEHGRHDLLPVLMKFTHEGEHGRGKPCFVLADLCFGAHVVHPGSGAVIPDATLQADGYGNSAWHVCAYKGNAMTMRVMLDHVESLKGQQNERFHVLASALAGSRTHSRRGAPGSTALEVAASCQNWACHELLAQFMRRHGLGTPPRPAEFVERRFDNAAEGVVAEKSACTFHLPGVGCIFEAPAVQSLGRWEEGVFARLRAEAAVGGGMAALALHIKGFEVLEPRPDVAFLTGLMRFVVRFKSVTFTRSRASAEAMDAMLAAVATVLAEPLTDQGGFACETLGLGVQPANLNSPGTVQPARMWSIFKGLAALYGSKRVCDIKMHRLWAERFSVPCGYLLHLLGAMGSALAVARDGGDDRGKGKGKTRSDQKNPLSKNPFVPGLCRIKNQAFAGWKRLCHAQSVAEAVHPDALPFLRLLAATWRLFELSCPDLGGHENALRLARAFLKQHEPLCCGATIDLFSQSTLREFDEDFVRQLEQARLAH